jgi:hypothetical protein
VHVCHGQEFLTHQVLHQRCSGGTKDLLQELVLNLCYSAATGDTNAEATRRFGARATMERARTIDPTARVQFKLSAYYRQTLKRSLHLLQLTIFVCKWVLIGLWEGIYQVPYTVNSDRFTPK